ncbi:MAG TPA: transglycosylase domain-containing protein [Ktedonosporobacter sp.]|jgi:membrane peptidoglycan carboxypeptidase|nr:transglycosylase domain-containing protein [Ktedonosporobacter sp.]
MSVNQQQSEDAQLPSFVAPRSKITIKLAEIQDVLAAPRSKITIKLPELQEIISEEAHAPTDDATISLFPATPLALPVPDLLPDDVLSLLKAELLPEPEEKELALNTTTGNDVTALSLSMLLLDDELTGPMVPVWHTALQPPVTPPLKVAEYAPQSVAGSLQRIPTHGRNVRRRKALVYRLTRKHRQRDRRNAQLTIRRRWVVLFSTVLSVLVLLLSLSGVGAFATYRFATDTQAKYLHSVLTLRDLVPRDNLKMYDSKGVMLAQLTDQGIHTSVALKDVSRDLINATIATEDKNFWQNSGIDLPRIIQAALDDIRSGRVVEGGSTITQQLIKNLIVGNETSVVRKLQEIALTPQVNTYYTKSDILEMYLNSIYYGEQAYGVDAAASVYFGLEDQPNQPASKQLDLAQAAMLAGLPSSPISNDPRLHPEVAFQRFETVLNLMVSEGYITKVQALEAIKEAQMPHFFKSPTNLVNRAPHFVNFMLSQLEQTYHLTRQQLSRSDMSVYTTLDIELQDKIQKIAQQHIAELRDAHHLSNAAVVLIDYHTGAIRTLLGSIDYNDKSIDGEFDVATQGFRQPGSSFKPYVYVTAFEQGASPAQAIDDQPLTIDLPPYSNPPTFTPFNYDRSYHGHMTLRCALQNSLNIPAVKVLQHVGIDAAMKTATDMGIQYKGTPGYSLVLGGLDVHLIDHTSAYGTFADGGVHVPYYGIDKIVFADTHQTIVHQTDPGQQVISPQLAYMMTSVLSDNASRTPEFFDCNVLQLYSNSQQDCWNGNRGSVRPAAAKTGTTNDFRDNWTVGYTTDYVMGVWAGNDDNTPMIDVTGVQGAAPIWHDAMLVAEQNHPIRDFTNPGGLEWDTVTYADGVQTSDWFLPGTAPTSFVPTPTAVPSPDPEGTPPPNSDNPSPVTAHPYCPSSYTFAFSPPSNKTPAGNAGWW